MATKAQAPKVVPADWGEKDQVQPATPTTITIEDRLTKLETEHADNEDHLATLSQKFDTLIAVCEKHGISLPRAEDIAANERLTAEAAQAEQPKDSDQ